MRPLSLTLIWKSIVGMHSQSYPARCLPQRLFMRTCGADGNASLSFIVCFDFFAADRANSRPQGHKLVRLECVVQHTSRHYTSSGRLIKLFSRTPHSLGGSHALVVTNCKRVSNTLLKCIHFGQFSHFFLKMAHCLSLRIYQVAPRMSR